MEEYKNILITGGMGFIGSNLLNYLVIKYHHINFYNIDCLNYCSNEENIKINNQQNYKFIKGHLQNEELLNFIFEEYHIDCVINTAAQSHVDNSFIYPLLTLHDNIVATNILLEVCRKYNIKKFIHFSTDEVYGESTLNDNIVLANLECYKLNPNNPYASTKAGIDLIIQGYIKTFKFPAIIIRPNNIYGPNQYIEKLIPRFITLLQNNEKLTIHGSGYNKRSFLYIDDLCLAIELLLYKGKIGEIYNIGSTCEYSVLEIATKLILLLKNSTDYINYIEYVDDRLYNDSRYKINCDKIYELGWTQRVTFDIGLNNTIKYYINNDFMEINL